MVSTKKAVDRTVSRFLKDVEGLMRQAVGERVLEAIRSSKRSAAAPARNRKRVNPRRVVEAALGRRRRATGNASPTSRETEELTDRLLEYIEAHPNQSIEQISRALGTEPESLRIPLSTLLREDHLVTEGEGAEIVYFAR